MYRMAIERRRNATEYISGTKGPHRAITSSDLLDDHFGCGDFGLPHLPIAVALGFEAWGKALGVSRILNGHLHEFGGIRMLHVFDRSSHYHEVSMTLLRGGYTRCKQQRAP